MKVRTRDSPAPSDSKKSNDPAGKRVSTSSLPWIAVHNVTKDQIDSTPVSLKKLGQAGNHNSNVSDNVNVILADVPRVSIILYILLVDTHTPHSVPSSCTPCQPLLVVSTSDKKYILCAGPLRYLASWTILYYNIICSPAYI